MAYLGDPRTFCGACGRHALQRLYSTFPDGPPGVGLLLLRAAVGAAAAGVGVWGLFAPLERTVAMWGAGLVLLIGGAALVVGILTPITCLGLGLFAFGIALDWFPVPLASSVDPRIEALVLLLAAIVIGLLGPGAFSLDSHLFGRREIIIPRRTPES